MWTLRGTAIFLFFLWLFLDGAVVFRRKTGKAENRDRFSMLAIMLGNLVAWAAGVSILPIHLTLSSTRACRCRLWDSSSWASASWYVPSPSPSSAVSIRRTWRCWRITG